MHFFLCLRLVWILETDMKKGLTSKLPVASNAHEHDLTKNQCSHARKFGHREPLE